VVIRGVVFDIDDTLYDERDYVRSGFSAVARVVARSDDEATTLADWLWTGFENGVRADAFDRLRAAFPDVAARVSTADLVDAYRRHRPSIALAPGAAETLDRLGSLGQRLGILTDGPVDSQAAKVAALGLARWCEPIIMTDEHDASFAKPGTAGFASIARAWGLLAAELVYVADNPAKDFYGPRRLGWKTVRVVHPRQVRGQPETADDRFRADVEIDDLTRLLSELSLDDRSRPVVR